LAENLSVFGPVFDFGEFFQDIGINFEFSTPKKVHPCVRPRRLSHYA